LEQCIKYYAMHQMHQILFPHRLVQVKSLDGPETVQQQRQHVQLAALQADHELVRRQELGHGAVQGQLDALQRPDTLKWIN
jgi:hypothetical protein